MKIKIFKILFIIIIFFSSIFNVAGQKNIDINENIETINLDDVPIWEIGDSWTYKIPHFAYEYSGSGQGFNFIGEINDFTWTVAKVETSTYELDFTGNLNCDYEIFYSTSLKTFTFTGTMEEARTSLSGKLIFTKSTLNLHDISGEIKGITKVFIGNLPFSLPIPFKLTFDGELNTDFPLYNFPLSNHKFWNLPEMDILLNMELGGIFGIIKMPITFQVHYPWVPLTFHCIEKQPTTVEAGTFDAWEIESTFFDLFNYYYSPEVKNLIKIDATLEYGSVNGELISTNIV